MHGFVDEMLIKCWFLVYRKVRGREGKFSIFGKVLRVLHTQRKSPAFLKTPYQLVHFESHC